MKKRRCHLADSFIRRSRGDLPQAAVGRRQPAEV